MIVKPDWHLTDTPRPGQDLALLMAILTLDANNILRRGHAEAAGRIIRIVGPTLSREAFEHAAMQLTPEQASGLAHALTRHFRGGDGLYDFVDETWPGED